MLGILWTGARPTYPVLAQIFHSIASPRTLPRGVRSAFIKERCLFVESDDPISVDSGVGVGGCKEGVKQELVEHPE